MKIFTKLKKNKLHTADICRKGVNGKKKEVNLISIVNFYNWHNFSSEQYWDSCLMKTRYWIKIQMTAFCLYI